MRVELQLHHHLFHLQLFASVSIGMYSLYHLLKCTAQQTCSSGCQNPRWRSVVAKVTRSAAPQADEL